jgi:hypothetical protein
MSGREGGCKRQVRYWTDNTVRPYQLRDRSQVSGYDYSKLLPKLTENQVSAAEDACDDVTFQTLKKKNIIYHNINNTYNNTVFI